MDPKSAGVLPGTLDLLILKAISLERLHGYGVLLRIRQISGEALDVPQGSLYPALNRLEHQGLIESEWGESENRRRAKYYRLTHAGRRRFEEDAAGWERLAAAMQGRPERDAGRGVTCRSRGCARSSRPGPGGSASRTPSTRRSGSTSTPTPKT